MRRTSKAHQLWPGRMIKMWPGLARPQLFRTLVRLIIFHLFRLRLAEIDPKKQDRPMAIHGWRMLYHLMSFDIIWCTGDVSRKTFGIAVFCMFCLLMSIGTVHHFQEKITRFISVSDRLWETRHRPCATPSASPGMLCWCPSYAKNDRNDKEK